MSYMRHESDGKKRLEELNVSERLKTDVKTNKNNI